MLLNEFANKASLALLQKPQLTHMEINFQWNISVFTTMPRHCRTNSILTIEFDPGSGRTLAACFKHASRTGTEGACFRSFSGGRVSNA